MNPIDDWERQRAFLAVLREGSLSAAARALGLAQPTVRRRVEDLEASVGLPLFTRSPGGLLPTEQALALAQHAEAMALAADAFVRSASAAAHEVAGTVRVSASDIIAIEVLPPILATLMDKHPRLQIVLSPTNRAEDILRREADVAVRMVEPRQEALVAKRIGRIPLCLHAHRDYLARHGTPATLDRVRSHRLIGVERDLAMLRVLQAQGFDLDLADFAFRTDDQLAHIAAIRAGLGIGLCQVPLARRDPALVPLFAESFTFPLDTWVVCHEDLRTLARVRAVFDALVEGLGVYLR
ncbi:LysR family transcriptional regulator [Sphingomonas sp.]|uniref:LysR family transcriptional regulator n=1 Tax=Sphingomonas sp. TaxID=28214 RepID=UPI001B12D8F7|nr:LysR family transcriptional regulator [Sphingomonas sp.]MBO9714393.1 LysR family transcriptional regulator [Sphingomonas sp.]